MAKIDAQRKYGLSATPERADGLTKVIHWITGPLLHHVPEVAVADKIVRPSYRSIDTTYTYPLFDSAEYGEMIKDLGNNDERNQLILETMQQYPTQQSVLLCHRQEHVERMQQLLPGSVILTSKTKKKMRVEIMRQLVAGEKRIVITTWQLFHKGIDLAELEILYACAPTRSKIWIKQSAGRLMRKSKKIDKKPVIVDFADKKIDLLKGQFYARRKVFLSICI